MDDDGLGLDARAERIVDRGLDARSQSHGHVPRASATRQSPMLRPDDDQRSFCIAADECVTIARPPPTLKDDRARPRLRRTQQGTHLNGEGRLRVLLAGNEGDALALAHQPYRIRNDVARQVQGLRVDGSQLLTGLVHQLGVAQAEQGNAGGLVTQRSGRRRTGQQVDAAAFVNRSGLNERIGNGQRDRRTAGDDLAGRGEHLSRPERPQGKPPAASVGTRPEHVDPALEHSPRHRSGIAPPRERRIHAPRAVRSGQPNLSRRRGNEHVPSRGILRGHQLSTSVR